MKPMEAVKELGTVPSARFRKSNCHNPGGAQMECPRFFHSFMKRKRRRSDAGGFTLVEMMVAVTLVALMSLLLWAALRSSVSSWKRGTESIDANQRHRATMDVLEKQMASIFPLIPPLDLQLGSGTTPIFDGSASGMQFISLCSFRFRDNPGLTLVSYEAVRGDMGDFSLVERETRYLGGDPTLQAYFIPDDEPATIIFDHLDSLEFAYYDPGTVSTPPQWVKDWIIKDQKRLPVAISLTLVARDANGALRSRQLVVPVLTKPDNVQPNFMDPFGDQRRRLSADDPRTRR